MASASWICIAVGGGVGWRLLGDPPPAPIVAAPVVAPVPVAPPPAPVVVPVAEVAPVPPAPVPAAPRPAAKLPQRLVGKDIGRVVSLSQAQVQKCLADNRALLPAVSGRLEVSFTVLDSGAVSEASVKTPLHATVVKCVVARFKDMRFPKHLERTQSFEFPFGYALKD